MGSFRLQSLEEKIAYEIAFMEYAEFLSGAWTGNLRSLGLIDQDEIITVHNWDTKRNMELLIKMRHENYTLYMEMMKKFIRFQGRIIYNGGTLQ